MVGRVFFKAVADDLSNQDFSARLGHPPADERRVHLCDIRIAELVEEIVCIAVEKALEQVWLRTAADIGQKIFHHPLVVLELPASTLSGLPDGFILALATDCGCAFAHRLEGESPLADAERLVAARPVDEPNLDGSLLEELTKRQSEHVSPCHSSFLAEVFCIGCLRAFRQ